MKRVVGRVFLDKELDKIVIDAEPHVMSKVRALFTKSQKGSKGKYTHKTIWLSPTMFNYRDVDWIMQRYPMDCDKDTLYEVTMQSKKYDALYEDISSADKDYNLKLSPQALDMTVTLRDHQVAFNNMAKKVKRILLADKMGLGKTIGSLSLLVEPERRPALIVVPPTLCTQWETVVKEVLPGISTHVIRGFKNYELPEAEILITSYNRLSPWQDTLNSIYFPTMICDEIHELRHLDTGKREAAVSLSEKVDMFLGLSGTPIFNYGSEIWSVLDVISPGCLGDRYEFLSEWCDSWDRTVHEPATLNSFLKAQGLMLRRTPEEVGLQFGDLSKTVCTIDSDIKELEKVQNIAKTLALSVLSGNINDAAESSRELDWKLRHATGVAKAKPAAEFVKMLLEEEKKVVVTVWHRDVYDILMKELKRFNPVMFSGSETVKQKEDALKRFIDGDSRVFLISLRSGAGIDGLQKACNTIVHAELDWSPHVMDQLNARLDRDGQVNHVNAYYLTIPDGSDPFMIQTLNVKRSQHDGLIEGKTTEAEVMENQADTNRIKKLAESYLKSIGEEIPEAVEETGLLKDVAEAIRNIKLPHTSEDEMQEVLENYLPTKLPDAKIEREYKVTKRSRLDFLVTRGNEKIAIECKINAFKRADVYRQVRRYVEEIQVDALALVAPWNAIPSFVVDETPVVVIDTSINAI